MANFYLSKIPVRSKQPRDFGITMISDKGLSVKETENVLSVASPYIDMVKLAFGTAMVTPCLKEKVKIYKSYGVPVFFGGVLFEAFVIRNQFEDYLKILDEYDISFSEISD